MEKFMEEATKKLLEETTRRIDILEKSKQKEEEEILSNSTQVIQEWPEKPVVKGKNDVKNKEANEET